jgi:YD repeat-containing protein
MVLLPLFIQNSLNQNYPGMSVSDLGMQIVNRRHLYSQWSDFPVPFALSGTPIVVESLKTNLNLFNTLEVQVYSQANPTNLIDTSEMYEADLQNRMLFLKFQQVGTNNVHNMILSLESYSTSYTNVAAFSTNANPNWKLATTNQLNSTDDAIVFNITHRRDKFLPPNFNTLPNIITNEPNYSYFEFGEQTSGQVFTQTSGQTFQQTDTFRKGDLVAFCFDSGRVSQNMLNVHAQQIWLFNQNANTNQPSTIDPDIYLGETSYLMGMSYFNYCDQFRDLDSKLHKVSLVSWYEAGYGVLRPKRDGTGALVNGGNVISITPAIHMPDNGAAMIFNGATMANSGRDYYSGILDWWLQDGVQGSAAEHGILKSYYITNAISTIKLLQQVGTNAVTLTADNYVTTGQKIYNGVQLMNADPITWASIVTFFATNADINSVVLMTPGAVTNGNYIGVAALLISDTRFGALVGGFNGGFANNFSDNTFSYYNSPYLTVDDAPDGSVSPFYMDTGPQYSSGSGNLVNGAATTWDLLEASSAISSGQVQLDPSLAATYASLATEFGVGQNAGSAYNQLYNFGTVTRQRPYLNKWQDSRGNFYTFQFGTDSTQPDYGEVNRIQSSNGNFVGFYYDVYGHIIKAYTGDGRWLYYVYDQYGDLTSVTLPDQMEIDYLYQHANYVTNGVTTVYSTHLIVEEDKPDGRVLQNIYDSQRRVTNQLTTAGVSLIPVRTATFAYTNNYSLSSPTNLLTGTTMISDYLNHPTTYYYTNSLVRNIVDPLNQTIVQNWYETNTVGGFQRSLKSVTDKRGLQMAYLYDAFGNLTNTVTTGDLTGNGVTTQTATNTASYNANNLPVQITDAAGNSTVVVYDSTFTFQPQQIIRYAGATPVSTNQMVYGNATNVVVNGSVNQTNTAFGVVTRQIRANGSPDAATNDLFYSGQGFVTNSIQYTGTGDPNVVNQLFYDERGELVQRTDAAGASYVFAFDPMGRKTAEATYDAGQNVPMDYDNWYYDANGELNWIDGPRYNPEDYVFYDYDGAGRPTTEIHWRSEANSTGNGVEAPAGYNVYAQIFNQFDPLGNLLSKTDPRGAMTTNAWDVLCRLTKSVHLDTNGVSVLSVEGFGYEAGGQVQSHTNALGGVTTTLYTTTGKPEFRSNPDGSTNAWLYYLDGRTYREIQSNGAYWQTTYDDVNRITTRIFYSAANVAEATNSVQLDRRGNTIQRVDAGGNIFTTTFDDLDRGKVTAGPAIVTVSSYQMGNPPSGPLYYTTNVLQQAITNYYDAAGRAMTNINALGEKTVFKSDAIGRPVSKQIYSASGALVHETYMGYSADHNSITTTNGSGASAIVSTTYTDNDGHTVLSIAYPSGGISEFSLNQYDLAGNVVSGRHESSASGTITTWTTANLTYDGLNRLTSKSDRDNALTTYAYDPMSDLTNRTMPGGLQWQAAYNNAGQMLQDRNFGGGTATRTNTYSYFSSGNTFAGLLQTKTDGRGVSCTYSYDDWLRQASMTYSGSLPEQNLTTTWQYEPRGYVTNITEQFASTNTGPNTAIQRSYDPYGQLASESVSAGSFGYGVGQSFDGAGRRSQLGIGSGSYGFGWQADGSLISVMDSTGNGVYTYDTAGILTSRTVGNRYTSINSRDGEGRPLSIATTVNTLTQMTESLTWLGDGLLASHTLARADFTDSRAYAYASLSRRLTQEQLNLNAGATWTNTLTYDNGVAAGPGVLTQMGQVNSTSNKWNSAADAFSRVSSETNNTFQFAAYGHVNGQSSLSGWLDSQPVAVSGTGTNAMQWRATMELTPGAHQLKVAAAHPSGFYTAWATNFFTNSIAYQATTDSYDSAGNITNRVWKSPNGTVDRTQILSWDARGRLHSLTERDGSNSGYNWTATGSSSSGSAYLQGPLGGKH